MKAFALWLYSATASWWFDVIIFCLVLGFGLIPASAAWLHIIVHVADYFGYEFEKIMSLVFTCGSLGTITCLWLTHFIDKRASHLALLLFDWSIRRGFTKG